jgi:hypothetical protein
MLQRLVFLNRLLTQHRRRMFEAWQNAQGDREPSFREACRNNGLN